MNKLLVVVGHADRASFTHAMALRYERAASAAGAQTELLELATLRFDPVLREGYRGAQPLEPDLLGAQAAIEAADHVAWFFPTWWAGPPALVKGFIDRTFLPGFAFRNVPGRPLPHKLLRGRSARLVTSMDAPWFWYALYYRSALHASFIAATLRYVGFSPVRSTTIFGLRNASARGRERSLGRLARAGARDARRLLRSSARARPSARPRLPARGPQEPEGSSNSSATPSAIR
jgi:putative NADPH-quinone reductase